MRDLADLPEGLIARAIGPADAEALVALSIEAGWNQTAGDWATLLELGAGIGVFDGARPAASAVALPYRPVAGTALPPIGFISMVLVTPAWQRRGLARRLTEPCVRHLEAARCLPVLDATPAGRDVYRKLGFADGIALDRWRAVRLTLGTAPAEIELHPIRGDTAQITALDAGAFGARRGPVIDALLARRPALAWAAWRGGRLVGFALGRDGQTATHVGPIVAADDAAAAALLHRVLSHAGGPAIIDLAHGHERLSTWLAAAGFAPVRSFTRMHRGATAPSWPGLYAAAGPEFG